MSSKGNDLSLVGQVAFALLARQTYQNNNPKGVVKMDINLQDVIVLGVAIWVMFQLPTWASKVIPAKVGKTTLPTSLTFLIKVGVAFLFANIGWKGLASSMDTGFATIKDIGGTSQVVAVIKVPEVILALITIIVSMWFVKTVFEHLKEPQDLTNALIALALIVGIFVFNNVVWDLLKEYVLINLNGAEIVIESDPFQTLFQFFSGEEGGGG